MTLLDEEKVHLTNLDSGELFVGGRFHSLVPILQEVYDGRFKYSYAVAVVKKKSTFTLNTLSDIRDKRACFAGVGTLAGWVIPIHTVRTNIFDMQTLKLKIITLWIKYDTLD